MGKEKKSIPPPLRKFMHPRNIYKIPPKFKELATAYPEFREHCTYDAVGKVHFNFKSPEALRILLVCLLRRDFQLEITLPRDRLVPTLPLRLNYLLWVEDLLNLSRGRKLIGDARSVVGLDVGTGAACIYPLLGSRHLHWNFLATETDEINLRSAKDNVHRNGLANSILVEQGSQEEMFDILNRQSCLNFLLKTNASAAEAEGSGLDTGDPLGDANVLPQYAVDFSMCNPPFFSSCSELDSVTKGHRERKEPSNSPTGCLQEKVVQGGEVNFIKRMVEESVKYQQKIRIFTTLVGCKANLPAVKKLVHSAHPCHVAVGEFCQGRTMRWGVGWTFDDKLQIDQVLTTKQAKSAAPITVFVPGSLCCPFTVLSVWRKVQEWLASIKIKPKVFKSNKYFVGAVVKAYKPTWLHQRQKRRKKLQQEKMAKATDASLSTKDSVRERIGEDDQGPKKKRLCTRDETAVASPEVLCDDMKHLDTNKSGPEILTLAADDCDREICEQSTASEAKSSVEVLTTGVMSDHFESKQVECTPTANKGSADDVAELADDCDMEKSLQCASSGLQCILHCWLHVKSVPVKRIALEMGPKGVLSQKDTINQLAQYLKNQMK